HPAGGQGRRSLAWPAAPGRRGRRLASARGRGARRGRRSVRERGRRRPDVPPPPGRLTPSGGAVAAPPDTPHRDNVMTSATLIGHGEPPVYFTFGDLAAVGVPHVTTSRH